MEETGLRVGPETSWRTSNTKVTGIGPSVRLERRARGPALRATLGRVTASEGTRREGSDIVRPMLELLSLDSTVEPWGGREAAG